MAEVREFTPGRYRIYYQCATPSLLRVCNAYFPGWRARVGMRSLPVVPVDYALLGVVVPAGEHDLTLDYHSTYFATGAWVTLIALLASAAALTFSFKFFQIQATVMTEPSPRRTLTSE